VLLDRANRYRFADFAEEVRAQRRRRSRMLVLSDTAGARVVWIVAFLFPVAWSCGGCVRRAGAELDTGASPTFVSTPQGLFVPEASPAAQGHVDSSPKCSA